VFVAFFMTIVSLLDLGFGKLVFEIFTGGNA
jgi:preprotein translocase subunit SecE